MMSSLLTTLGFLVLPMTPPPTIPYLNSVEPKYSAIQVVEEPKVEPKVEEPKTKEAIKEVPEITYKVEQGDNLTSIANKFNTTWERLYAKNKRVANQDVLEIGEELIIPQKNEKLAVRKPVRVVTTENVNIPTSTSKTSYRGSQTANTYSYGWCTWYAKQRRPDIGNMWGNANQWLASAQASGFSTGSVPKAGAIGVSFVGIYGHVVYVESVNGHTVTVSDMNGIAGFGNIGTFSAPASNYTYIY